MLFLWSFFQISHIKLWFFSPCNVFTGNLNCFEVCKTCTYKHGEKLCLVAIMWAQSKMTVDKDIWQRFLAAQRWSCSIRLQGGKKTALAQFLHPYCCELQQRVTAWDDEGQTTAARPALQTIITAHNRYTDQSLQPSMTPERMRGWLPGVQTDMIGTLTSRWLS